MRKTTRLKKPQIPELDTLYQFDDLGGRPKYGGVEMTSATSIPSFEEIQRHVDGAIAEEAAARGAADDDLEEAIEAVSSDLSDETDAREAADNNLQSEIDTIVAASDVKDIVGTYAQLQAYDTSTLGDNDIIKVLQDETQQNQTTYYRWSTITETFSLIGAEGPYYTKSATDTLLNAKADKATTYTKTEVDTALAGKQNTLAAGDHISFNGDTINAECDSVILHLDNAVGDGNFVKFYRDSGLTDEVVNSDLVNLVESGKAISLVYDDGDGYVEIYQVSHRYNDWGNPCFNIVGPGGFYYIDMFDGPTYSGGRVNYGGVPYNVQKKLIAGTYITIQDTLNGPVIDSKGLTTLSYGTSTWNDFINAYNAGKIVYCRASSNANPATGSQTRMAFMAYVSAPTNPTSVEFQYVRSVSSKTASAQCDQVFVYKLTNANGGTWTVETRDMASTVVAGANAESTYSGTTITINPRLYTTTGQNTNGGITQKLFTDTVGNIEAALNAINNGGNA